MPVVLGGAVVVAAMMLVAPRFSHRIRVATAAAGVMVEVALWPHTITLHNGDTLEVLNATICRTYKDAGGQWRAGGSFRISEIPVLVHALMRAHGFALDQRELTCPL